MGKDTLIQPHNAENSECHHAEHLNVLRHFSKEVVIIEAILALIPHIFFQFGYVKALKMHAYDLLTALVF